MKKTKRIGGLEVLDAAKELHVRITARDVKAGATKEADACAAAVALMRQTGCSEAKVHVRRTYIKKGKKWVRYETPEALRKEIVAFDRGGTFEPGEYKLLPVPPSDHRSKKAKRDVGRPSSAKARTGRLKGVKKIHVTTGIRERFNIGGRFV